MKNFLYSLAIVFLALLTGCGSKDQSSDESSTGFFGDSDKKEEQTAVCVLDKLAVRDAPNKGGKYLTSMSLGENVALLGAVKKDSVEDREYTQVKLLDGTEGWALSNFLVPGGKAIVFVEDAEVYKRPDLLTKANKKYSPMDIVAVKQQQGDWMEVTGKRTEGKYIETGWVKNSGMSDKAEDIAVAKFAQTALAMENEDEKIEAIKQIIDNSDLSGSVFISKLREKLYDIRDDQIDLEEPYEEGMGEEGDGGEEGDI